jgi:hypothetical protein
VGERIFFLSHTVHYMISRSWSEILLFHFNYAYANLRSMQVVHWLACCYYFFLQIIALRAKHTYRVKFNTNASLSMLHFYFYINLYLFLKYKFIFFITINSFFSFLFRSRARKPSRRARPPLCHFYFIKFIYLFSIFGRARTAVFLLLLDFYK